MQHEHDATWWRVEMREGDEWSMLIDADTREEAESHIATLTQCGASKSKLRVHKMRGQGE